jgi:hypothetical protein
LEAVRRQRRLITGRSRGDRGADRLDGEDHYVYTMPVIDDLSTVDYHGGTYPEL